MMIYAEDNSKKYWDQHLPSHGQKHQSAAYIS